jgi:predicted MPP superfamily phosphohydrolase
MKKHKRISAAKLKSAFYAVYLPMHLPVYSAARCWKKDNSVLCESRRSGDFTVSRYRLPACAPGAAGKRLAFVSDLHFRKKERVSRRLDNICREISDFDPDLLLLGGDLVFDACSMEEIPPMLEALSASAKKTLAVNGNWEQGKNWISETQWREIYGSADVELLCNQHWQNSWIDVYGARDFTNGYPEPPVSWSEGTLHIMLAHRPDTALSLWHNGVAPWHLSLSGHTHGGQWAMPVGGAFFGHSYYGRKFNRGYFVDNFEGAAMIVGSGLGEGVLPWRFNCPRELVLVEFF